MILCDDMETMRRFYTMSSDAYFADPESNVIEI
jgi:hypothetical protein